MSDRFAVSVARIASPRLIGLAFILAAGLAAFADASLVAAQRGGPAAPDAYQGCVNTYTGVLRIVADGQPCQDHETAIKLGASAGDAALLERIEALEADNADQQTLIDAQQGVIDDQQTEITTLEDAHTALQAQAPDCLSTAGDEVYFTGCNVNVRSGSGATEGAVNGLGNLVIGYNESEADDPRTGSHNLVIGTYHSYTSYGGLVAGYSNTISGSYSSVSGGTFNMASGTGSSVSGGSFNTASGTASSVGGGNRLEVDGFSEFLP